MPSRYCLVEFQRMLMMVDDERPSKSLCTNPRRSRHCRNRPCFHEKPRGCQRIYRGSDPASYDRRIALTQPPLAIVDSLRILSCVAGRLLSGVAGLKQDFSRVRLPTTSRATWVAGSCAGHEHLVKHNSCSDDPALWRVSRFFHFSVSLDEDI